MHGDRSPLAASLQPCAICMTLVAAPRAALISSSRIAPMPPFARKFEHAGHWSRDKAICIWMAGVPLMK
jgi:hypothetical protein